MLQLLTLLSLQQHSGGTVEIVIGGLQLARIVENGDILTGSVGTSIAATAPEVYRAIYYGKAVDLWALGILLYEFMTGGLHPFRGDGRNLRAAVANARLVFDDFYPGSPESRDLIRLLICADPRHRLTASQALAHHWFFKTDTLARNDLSLVQDLLNGEE
jgi:serine/threonine protein kinase